MTQQWLTFVVFPNRLLVRYLSLNMFRCLLLTWLAMSRFKIREKVGTQHAAVKCRWTDVIEFQVIKSGRLAEPYKGIVDCARRTYADEGVVSCMSAIV